MSKRRVSFEKDTYEVDHCVVNVLCSRHEIPVKDKEGVRGNMLAFWALVEMLCEIFLRPQGHVFLSLTMAVLDIPQITLRSSQHWRLSKHFCNRVLFGYVSFV